MNVDELYTNWMTDPSRENMGAIIKELSPIITSESARYNGPKALLKNRAKPARPKFVTLICGVNVKPSMSIYLILMLV